MVLSFVKKRNSREITFTSEGYYMLPLFDDVECLLFPSKENRDWSKFQKPFKDGDVIFTHANCLKVGLGNTWVSIFKEYRNDGVDTYVDYNVDGDGDFYFGEDKGFLCMKKDILRQRFATEEEKQKLFDAIKANGYKWKDKTKTLEKLIIPNKFDITNLKPFDKVLVRDNDESVWFPALYGNIRIMGGKTYYMTVNGHYKQCIPFEGNEHLLGTTNDCDEYYKTWE